MNRVLIQKDNNKTIYLQDNKCFKVFNTNYNVGNILNEALNHARVQDTDLNVPRLLGVTQVDNQWAIITEEINGTTLQDLIDNNPNKIDEYLNRFVDIQINAQSKHCPLLSKHNDKMNRKIAQTDLSATLRYDFHNRIESMPHNNYLCHGDYNPSNVMIDVDNNAYIIDWSHATEGNREADSARTYLLFLIDGKTQIARKYVDLYCEKTGCKIIDVLNWLPILAATQSVKGIKNESNFLNELIYMDGEGLMNLYEKI